MTTTLKEGIKTVDEILTTNVDKISSSFSNLPFFVFINKNMFFLNPFSIRPILFVLEVFSFNIM